MKEPIAEKLSEFVAENKMRGKGALSVALVVTRRAMAEGLPLSPRDLLAESGGQVAGLSKSSVQTILADHGIERVLAQEGGRTNRGSIGKMKAYVSFLNILAEQEGGLNLQEVERWWIERVREYFGSKPLELRLDPSNSIRHAITMLLNQAMERQNEVRGATTVGTVLQHLIGAKLSVLLDEPFDKYGASVADEGAKRAGDFEVGDAAIHVTTAPSEALIKKCRDNLRAGKRPVVVTLGAKVSLAEGLAQQGGIAERLDVFGAEQFIAGNIYELGAFHLEGRTTSIEELVNAYNGIVDTCETDPSLRIKFG